jgi:glycosyltransferase involved in cell wall biosynthesis
MTQEKLKHIYWFAYYNLDSPSVRYRAKYPLDYARNNLNIESHFIIPGYSPSRLIQFLSAYFSALLFPKKGSIIVIQRVHSNFIYSNLLKLLVNCRRNLTIYDLDDADYLEYPSKTIHYFAKNCNSVSAGSNEITNYFRSINSNAFHITSPIVDLEIIKPQRNEIFTIGWIGGFGWGHKESLYDLVFPAIKNLSFNCHFILMGVTNQKDEEEIRDYFKNSKQIDIEMNLEIDWNDEEALQHKIKTFDIGIATLLNTPVQIAKSGIKAKQYLNNGVPVLCNKLPENKNVIIDGVNGYLCNSPEEFKTKMIEFKEMDNSAYNTFSKNARQSITQFNHQNYFDKLETLKVI